MTDTKNILDRSITKKKNSNEVALASFSFLFSEMIQYSQGRVNQTNELQVKLYDFGYQIGTKFYELSAFREKNIKRETKITNILYYIQTNLWKTLYGEKADALERSEKETDYMIYEQSPLITKFISVPKELDSLKCEYFNAGIIKGVLDSAEFPSTVQVLKSPKNWIS
eukprot:gene9843-2166_t